MTVGLTDDGLAARLDDGLWSVGLSRSWSGELVAGLEATWRF